jgi:arylsulfatase A-like enzyme
MNERPNILFINTDQHSWDAISAYGNPFLRTPNIDELHRNGTSFRRSFCTDPVCAAARSSWATGLYTSETGVPFNGGYLHPKIPDLGQLLNAGGYKAFHCGKWHVPGRNVRESFQTLYYGRQDIGAGGAAYYDSASTHAVADFLTNYDGDDPFYLQIGYVDPHDVCEYLHNHEEKRIPNPLEQGIVSEDDLPPLPENFDYDERETVLHRVCRRVDDALIHAAILKGIRGWDERHWRYLRWNYYRFIEKVDAEIGRVLALLRETSLHHNTLIIFSADHGEACGSHQMFQKFTLYEESVRVPFIVACLGEEIPVEKDRFDETHFVSGVDLFPTVCDYAGIDVPEEVQGLSIRPLAEGRDAPWRDYAYIESNYWGRAIVTDRYKYVTEYKPTSNSKFGVEDFQPPGPNAEKLGLAQLFDRQNDPGETENLAGNPTYDEVVKICRNKLFAQEARLHRQQIVHPSPKRVISNWGDRLRTYWQMADSH